jgi:hypothetical protein
VVLNTRTAGVLWPALVLLACGGDANGPESVPALGSYSYQATLYVRTPAPVNFSGTLTLTYASADSIAGVWDVPGYQPAGRFGRRMDDQWELDARPTNDVAAVEHRINPDGTCASVTYAWFQGELIIRTTGSCTLTKE